MKKEIRKSVMQINLRVALTLLTILFGIGAAQAAVYTVDTTADNAALSACTGSPNDCSLRSAIANANLNGQADTINFDATVFAAHQTINLNDGFSILPDGKLTISGPAAGVTLSLANSNLSSRRVFTLDSANANLEISHLTLTGGRGLVGGGIYNDGGTVTLNDSTISGNSVPAAGGIFNDHDGMLTLINSTVSNNRATAAGGGIINFGTMTMINSTVSGNSSNFGGGGIFQRFSGNTMTMTNSTISGNSAPLGGGIVNLDGSTATLINTTVSNNSASRGGSILNTEAAGATTSFSTINLNNSIIANSTSGGDCVRDLGTINAEYTLIEGGLGCVNGINSNNLTGDPNLGPLQNNGGPTETHALLPGSRAIDAGNSTLTTDQRGIARPQGPAPDLGSFELSFLFYYSSQLLGSSQMPYFTDAAAGSDVQVSYSLRGYKGANPYSQPPTSQRIDCFTKSPTGAATPIQTYSGDPFYNPLYDFYTTIWQTPVSYAGTCRRLTLYFNDGTTQSQDFRFR